MIICQELKIKKLKNGGQDGFARYEPIRVRARVRVMIWATVRSRVRVMTSAKTFEQFLLEYLKCIWVLHNFLFSRDNLFWLHGGHLKNPAPHKSTTNYNHTAIVTKLIKISY